jgi:hypothetical protein
MDMSDLAENAFDLAASDSREGGSSSDSQDDREDGTHEHGLSDDHTDMASLSASSDGSYSDGSAASSGSDDGAGGGDRDGGIRGEGRNPWEVTDAELEGVNILDLPSPSTSGSLDGGEQASPGRDIPEGSGMRAARGGGQQEAAVSEDEASEVSFDDAAFLRSVAAPPDHSTGSEATPSGSERDGKAAEASGRLAERGMGDTRRHGKKRRDSQDEDLGSLKVAGQKQGAQPGAETRGGGTVGNDGVQARKRRKPGSKENVFAAYEDYVDVIEDIVKQQEPPAGGTRKRRQEGSHSSGKGQSQDGAR